MAWHSLLMVLVPCLPESHTVTCYNAASTTVHMLYYYKSLTFIQQSICRRIVCAPNCA